MSDVVTMIRDTVGDAKGITLTGSSAISKDINAASQRDLMTAEAIGLPIAIIILLFAFGTVVASFVPLIIGIVTVVTSFGLLTMIGGQMDLIHFRAEYYSDARTRAQYRFRIAVHQPLS